MSKVPNISTLPTAVSKKKVILVSAAALAVVVTTMAIRSHLGSETEETTTTD